MHLRWIGPTGFVLRRRRIGARDRHFPARAERNVESTPSAIKPVEGGAGAGHIGPTGGCEPVEKRQPTVGPVFPDADATYPYREAHSASPKACPKHSFDRLTARAAHALQRRRGLAGACAGRYSFFCARTGAAVFEITFALVLIGGFPAAPRGVARCCRNVIGTENVGTS